MDRALDLFFATVAVGSGVLSVALLGLGAWVAVNVCSDLIAALARGRHRGPTP